MPAAGEPHIPDNDFGPGKQRVNPVRLIEQVLDGLQPGVMLFLIAAGLTLIFAAPVERNEASAGTRR